MTGSLLSRRQSLGIVGGLLSRCIVPELVNARNIKKTMTLGFGTYGTRGISTEESLRLIRETGYDTVELTVFPGWDASAENMSTKRRRSVKKLLGGLNLELTSLMENIHPDSNQQRIQMELDRVEKAVHLAKDLGDSHVPLVQTVLGGGTWEEKKNLFVDRLGQWLEVATAYQVTIAIKPHRGGAMSRPSEAAWIIDRLNHPERLKMVYDYSHYAFRDMDLEDTVKTALPITAHIAVKDTVKTESGTTFVLPGESGRFDYAPLLRQFHKGGYRGDVCCEVSSAVWRKPNYDPRAAIRICYQNMNRAFQRANISRTD